MKNSKKIICTALSAALIFSAIAPTGFAANSKVEKEESVFGVLNADGSVNSITVSDWLHSDSGFSNYKDETQLADIVNLKGEETPEIKDGTAVWNSEKTDIYYQGSTQNTLPVTAQITYSLDGTEMNPQDMLGKSGHVVITINLTNNQIQSKTINGKTYNVATPFATAVGTVLGTENFNNIKAENGTVQTDSSNQVVAFVALPGVKDSLGQLLTGSFKDLQKYLLDQLVIEADTTNFECPSIMIACGTDASALKDSEQLKDFEDTFSDLDKLKDATTQLIDGAQSLYDGTIKLNNAVTELKTSVDNDLVGGVAQLYSGTQSLVGYNAAITAGSADLAAGVVELVNTALADKLPSGVTVTKDNYKAVFDAMLNVTEGQKSAAKAQIQQILTGMGVADTATQQTIIFTANALLSDGSCKDINSALSAAGTKAEHAGVVATVIATMPEGYTQDELATALALAVAKKYTLTDSGEIAAMAVTCQEDAVYVQTAAAKADENEILTQAVLNSAEYQQGTAQIAKLRQLIDGAYSLSSSLVTYTNGVATVNSGAGQLSAGVSKLQSGVNQIKTEGTQALVNGANEFLNGVNQYNTDGISKITENSNINSIKDICEIISEMKTQTEEYQSFSGVSEKTDCKVKFIMKTNAPVKAEEKITDIDQEQAPQKTSFWQRVKDLFTK